METTEDYGVVLYSHICSPAQDMKHFGEINDRQIKYLRVLDNSNWRENLPTSNWLAIPFGDKNDIEIISSLAQTCLDNGVNYVCTIGQACEFIHDIFDEEIAHRVYVKEQPLDTKIYGDGEPMTTWHVDMEEGVRFSINTAFADKMDIDSIIILDITDAGGLETIENVIMKLA